MAASAIQLGIKISADGRQAEQALGRTRAGLESISRQLNTARNAFLALQGAMGLSAGLSGLGRLVDQVRSVDARLRQVTTSTQEFAAAQRLALDLSAKTGAGYEAVAALYSRLAMTAKDYGLNQERVAAVTEITANALKVSGASASESASVITQLSQALGSGVLRGDEFNSIMENSGALAKALADGLGLPIGKLRALAEQGLLTTDIMVTALESQRAKLAQAAAAMPRTIGQSLTAMRDAFGQTIVQMDQTIGVSHAAGQAFDALARHMQGIVAVGLPTALAGIAVMLGRAAGAGASYLGDVYRRIVADNAARASAIALAAARLDFARAELAAAQATVASTAGMARLTAVQTVLVPAQQRMTAAQTALNAAQAAGSLTARTLSAALAGLGGPVGLIVTLLTAGATAWMLWGDRAAEAGDKAKSAADKARDAIEQANAARDRIERAQKFGSGDAGTLREGVAAAADQIVAKTREIVEAQRAADQAAQRMRFAREGGDIAALADYQRQLDRIKTLRAEVAGLQRDREANIARLRQLEAAGEEGAQAPGAPSEAARMLANRQWDAYIANYRSKADQLAAAMAELKTLAKQKGLSEDSAEFRAAAAAVRKRYAEDAKSPTLSSRDTEAVARAQADARLALVKDELARAKTLLDEGYQDRLLSAADYYRQKAALDQRENAAEQERLRAQLDSLQRAQAKARPGERERIAGELVQAQAQLDILQRQAADIERKAARATAKAELDSVDQQLSRAQTLLQAVEQSAQARVAIGLATEVEARRMVVEATRAQGEALARELIPQIERLLATVTDPVVLAQLQAALDKVRQMQAEGREKTAFDGLSQSVRDYAAKAADAFGSAREAATRAFQGIEDALTDLVVKGKADFRGLVVSILADLARLQLQQGLAKLFQIALPGLAKNAAGGVYASPSLSAYSGGVYDSPRVFAFAKGVGVFGEAGPEAIMPLKRGRDGKLGVVAQGGGGGSITVNVAVDASGQRDGVGGDARGLDLGRRIQAAVKAVLVDEQRPGGLLAGRA